MALCRKQIENWLNYIPEDYKADKSQKHYNKKGKKWYKKQMNKYIRHRPLEEYYGKIGRKPTSDWEY